MKKILIAGGSGFIGNKLKEFLKEKYQIFILSRDPQKIKDPNAFFWNPSSHEIEEEALKNCYAVINLSGAGIADKRWSERYKKTLYESRIKSTEFLTAQINKEGNIPVFISGSAIGFYGDTKNGVNENSKAGQDFLARLCIDWEKASEQINSNTRLVICRTGIVMDKSEGLLKKFLLPSKLGVAAPLGNGDQLISWIHIKDFCRMIEMVLENENIVGVYNACTPDPVSNNKLNENICREIKRPYFLPGIPEFLLKIIFGEMTEILLYNQNAYPEKMLNNGFKFQYPEIRSAIADLLKK